MGMIERYRKRGGFLQLLVLLEATPPLKQEKFLSLIAEEDSQWEKAIREKMLTPQRIMQLDQASFLELAGRIPPLNMAVFLTSVSSEEKDRIYGWLNSREKRQMEEALSLHNIQPGEVHSCYMRLASEFRELVRDGKIKLEKTFPDLVIDENIEEKLNGKPSVEKLLAEIDGGVSSERATEQISEEIFFLKKKITLLQSELQKTLQENAVLKSKLDQIRKIA